jgi:hypothetical protein
LSVTHLHFNVPGDLKYRENKNSRSGLEVETGKWEGGKREFLWECTARELSRREQERE